MASVLLIDDDALVRATVAMQLELGGHTVAAVADGGAGLKAFDSGTYDAVVTDIIMPGIEGVETIRRLRQMDPAVVIVAMTGGPISPFREQPRTGSEPLRRQRPDYLRMVTQLGATETIRKPFTGPALLAKISEALLARAGVALSGGAVDNTS